MKKFIFLLSLVSAIIVLSFNGCKRLDKLVSFNLAVENQFVVPVFPDTVLTDLFVGNEIFSYLTDNLRFSNEKEFEKNKTFPTRVESCEIQAITLSIDSGSISNFNKIKNIELYIGGNIGGNEVLIGKEELIQSGQGSITFIPSITNDQFKDEIRRDLYKLRLVIEWNAPIDDIIYFKCSMSFRIKAQPTED